MKVYGLEWQQWGHKFYSVVLPAPEVVKRVTFDRFSLKNSDGKGGSQREAITSHVNDYKRFCAEGNPSQRSILLNYRLPDALKVNPVLVDGGVSRLVEIHLPDDILLFCYDGQHFVLVQEALVAAQKIADNFEVAITLSNMTREEEMLSFFVINNTARGVDKGIGQQQIANFVKNGGNTAKVKLLRRLPPSLNKEVSWLPDATEAVNALYKDKASVWHERVELAGLGKGSRRGDFPVRQQSVVRSLEPIFKELGHLGLKKILPMLNALWLGTYTLWAEPFMTTKEYILFSVTGVTVLHRLFLNIYEEHRGDESALCDPDTYRDYLKLSGWTSDTWKKCDVGEADSIGSLVPCWRTYDIVYGMLVEAIVAGKENS